MRERMNEYSKTLHHNFNYFVGLSLLLSNVSKMSVLLQKRRCNVWNLFRCSSVKAKPQ